MRYTSAGQFRAWLSRIRYKDNFSFGILDPDMTQMVPYATLLVNVEVRDSRGSNKLIMVSGTFPLNMQYSNFEQFYRDVRNHIQSFELHEMDEWFRVDGELPFDPHQPKVRYGSMSDRILTNGSTTTIRY